MGMFCLTSPRLLLVSWELLCCNLPVRGASGSPPMLLGLHHICLCYLNIKWINKQIKFFLPNKCVNMWQKYKRKYWFSFLTDRKDKVVEKSKGWEARRERRRSKREGERKKGREDRKWKGGEEYVGRSEHEEIERRVWGRKTKQSKRRERGR